MNARIMRVCYLLYSVARCLEKQDSDVSSLAGKEILPAITRSNLDEYNMLTEEMKASLLTKFEEYKATKSSSYRISARSQVNDITYTLRAIENEVFFCTLVLSTSH